MREVDLVALESGDMEVSQNGPTQNGWCTRENPIEKIKMDDLGVPLF